MQQEVEQENQTGAMSKPSLCSLGPLKSNLLTSFFLHVVWKCWSIAQGWKHSENGSCSLLMPQADCFTGNSSVTSWLYNHSPLHGRETEAQQEWLQCPQAQNKSNRQSGNTRPPGWAARVLFTLVHTPVTCFLAARVPVSNSVLLC